MLPIIREHRIPSAAHDYLVEPDGENRELENPCSGNWLNDEPRITAESEFTDEVSP